MTGEPITIALPLGIGDVLWVCQKLRGLQAMFPDRPIHAYISQSPNHKSVGFLDMVPYVAEAHFSPSAIYDIQNDLSPEYKSPHWSRLKLCGPWRGFTYCLQANGHLEMGLPINTYLPELETEYCFELNIPEESRERARDLAGTKPVLLYPSGTGPNRGFHNNTWTKANWAEVVRRLNAEGITPVLIGAHTPDDMGYRDVLRSWLEGTTYVDLVGDTDIPTVTAMIESASAWCGLNSGLGIISAMRKTPTVMLWSDARYRMQGVGVYLHPNMKTSWLNEEQLQTYRTHSYGSPQLTPEAVVTSILEVMR